MTSKADESDDLFSYLEKLPRPFLLSIYDDPRGSFAAKTILQKLPELAQQLVVRLSVCGGSFKLSHINSWYASSGTKRGVNGQHRINHSVSHSLQRMQALCVIEPLQHLQKSNGSDEVVQLTSSFKKAVKTVFTVAQSSPWQEVSVEELERLDAKAKQADEVTSTGVGGSAGNSGSSSKYPNQIPTYEELETFTQKRWNSVLHYLVGSDDTTTDTEDPPNSVILFLEETGLMQEDPDWVRSRSNSKQQAPLVITSKGYEFMLQEVHVQVWQFIMQYFDRLLKSGKSSGLNDVQKLQKEAILFLLCLSYTTIGTAYNGKSVLSKEVRFLLKDFSCFGLLYVCKVGGVTLFYPTRVAVNLVVGSLTDHSQSMSGGGSGKGISESTSHSALSCSAVATRALESELANPVPGSNHLAIILQTNFVLSAYTTSPLHVSMLGLFCDVNSFRRLPNVIFYRITRDSIKGAFKYGIKVQQILKFLKMHAHPHLRTGDQPLIPSNVEDQIILWDREQTRVRMEEVYAMQCQSSEEYVAARKFALDHAIFCWSSEEQRNSEGQNRIMVKYRGAKKFDKFVRSWRRAKLTS